MAPTTNGQMAIWVFQDGVIGVITTKEGVSLESSSQTRKRWKGIEKLEYYQKMIILAIIAIIIIIIRVITI